MSLTASVISDFAHRKVQSVEEWIGRKLTIGEKKQARGFFGAMANDCNTHKSAGTEWDSLKFWNENAPEIVKTAAEKADNRL